MKEIDRRAGSGIGLSRFFADLAVFYSLAKQVKKEESGSSHINALLQYAKAIEGEVEILKLGLDYKGFQRYRDFAKIDPLDHFNIDTSGNMAEALTIVKEKVDSIEPDFKLQEWVVFAFGFVMDSILRWQLIRRPGLSESLIRSLGRLSSDIKHDIKQQDTVVKPLDQPP